MNVQLRLLDGIPVGPEGQRPREYLTHADFGRSHLQIDCTQVAMSWTSLRTAASIPSAKIDLPGAFLNARRFPGQVYGPRRRRPVLAQNALVQHIHQRGSRRKLDVIATRSGIQILARKPVAHPWNDHGLIALAPVWKVERNSAQRILRTDVQKVPGRGAVGPTPRNGPVPLYDGARMQLAQGTEIPEPSQFVAHKASDTGEQHRQSVAGMLVEVAESVVSRDPEHLPQWRQGGRRRGEHRHATELPAILRRSARLPHVSDLLRRDEVPLVVHPVFEQRMRQVRQQDRLPGEGRFGDSPHELSVDTDLVATDNRLVPFSLPFGRKFQPPCLRTVEDIGFLQQGYVACRQHDRHVSTPPRELGQAPIPQVQLEAKSQGTRRIVPMDETPEPPEVDLVAAELGGACVDVAVAEDLVGVAQRMEDRALAGAVAAEQQGDRPQVDPHRTADALEVLDLDGGDQRGLLPGRFSVARRLRRLRHGRRFVLQCRIRPLRRSGRGPGGIGRMRRFVCHVRNLPAHLHKQGACQNLRAKRVHQLRRFSIRCATP